MNNTMTYKGYTGTVEISDQREVFCGTVLGIRDLIFFEGRTYKELVDDFHGAIDDYLDVCKSENKEPEKPFKGTFNVRIQPELHRLATITAIEKHLSLNSFVEFAIRQAVGIKI